MGAVHLWQSRKKLSLVYSCFGTFFRYPGINQYLYALQTRNKSIQVGIIDSHISLNCNDFSRSLLNYLSTGKGSLRLQGT